MALTLHLGVLDQPYAHEGPEPPQRGRRRRRVATGTQTTGDVATWLENRYHVMRHFYELHEGDVAAAMENSLAGAVETALMGGPSGPGAHAFDTAMGEVKQTFSTFLTLKEMDALGYPGVPTLASLLGISHRFKDRRGTPGRPSFIDTGLYETSFRSWVD